MQQEPFKMTKQRPEIVTIASQPIGSDKLPSQEIGKKIKSQQGGNEIAKTAKDVSFDLRQARRTAYLSAAEIVAQPASGPQRRRSTGGRKGPRRARG